MGFNSLQTGKCIQSVISDIVNAKNQVLFQFPSNGKVYSELESDEFHAYIDGLEFQFPSNGKVYSEKEKGIRLTREQGKFQFPSNGKVYSEKIPQIERVVDDEKFQFPSNGKVYSEIEVYSGDSRSCLFQFPSNGKVYSEDRSLQHAWHP